MESVTCGILVIFVVCIFLYLSKRDPRLPPGPFKWPFIGNLLSVVPRDYLTYTKWRKYGDLITVYFGPRPVMVLNSYKAINDAFLGQADIFAGRAKTEYFNMITHDSGILFQDGPLWQEHRRFTLRMLKDFGVGRNVGETIVREECEALCSKLDTLLNTKIKTRPIFTSAINNVIARLTFGERCGSEDPEFEQFTRNLDDTLNFRLIDLVPIMFPWVLRIPPLLRVIEYFSQMRYKIEGMHSYIKKLIEKQSKTLQTIEPGSMAASNLCEAYLMEQARHEQANPGSHTFTEWQIIRNMFELFLAGTETTSTTLTWAILLLAIHPEIQKKIQLEIEENIGTEKTPNMSDLKDLPYLHAVMDEVLRYSSLVPSNVGHRPLRDTYLYGYYIPYDTIITSNLYAVHHDPELWENPEQFYPEHFLDESGEYRPSKYLIPFSLGKRACLGEGLARMEYFGALASMMQRYNVTLSDSDMKRVDSILFGSPGGIRQTLPHDIIFTKRSEFS